MVLVFYCHRVLSSAICSLSSGTKAVTKPLPVLQVDTSHSLSTLDQKNNLHSIAMCS